jgi:hypothetical protein
MTLGRPIGRTRAVGCVLAADWNHGPAGESAYEAEYLLVAARKRAG